MKKFLLKLLKDWTDPAGKAWKAGQTVEIEVESAEQKAAIADMIADGIAEKSASKTIQVSTSDGDQPDVEAIVKAAVKAAITDKSFSDDIAQKVHSITVKDLSDDDPTFGYLPAHQNGRKHSKSEIEHGMGLFAMDVFRSANGRPSERLAKCIERSEAMVAKALADGIITKAAGTGMTLADGESTGALVPPEFSTTLLDLGAEVAQIRPRATVVPTGLAGIEFPKPKNYDHSSKTIFGGVKAYWVAENEQLSETAPKFENIRLTPHGLAALAFASDKTMRSAPPAFIGGFLLPSLARGITFAEEYAFLWGTGAGQPLGIMNSPGRLEVAKETGQTNGTVVVSNVDKMYAALRIQQAASVAWLYNRPLLYAQLVTLQRALSTGSNQLAALFTNVGGEERLSGYPLLNSEFCSEVGYPGDIILADFSQYLIADDRSGAEIAQSMHLKFDYAQMAFRILKYVDGQCMDSSKYTTAVGSGYTSSVVTLAARHA